MGNKTDKNQENLTYLNNTIISDFVLIESSLFRLEHILNEARKTVISKHLQYQTKLEQKFINSDTLTNDIVQKNEYLKRKLNRTKRYSFLEQKVVFKFKEFNKQFDDIIIEEYYFNLNRRLTIEKKIKYLHLYNEFEIVDTDHIPFNCYNFIIIPLNRNRIFYCCGIFEKKSFLKITNKYGVELHRSPISPSYYYRQFMAFNEHIAGLFDDQNNEINIIEIYNHYLQTIAKRTFKNRLELWSMADDQLILRTVDSYEYTVYNFNLELRFTLNISRIINETGLRNSICLTGLDENQIYLFYSMLKKIKTIDKKTGLIKGNIDFEKDVEIKSNLSIRFDSNKCFLIKHTALNSIAYFSKQGQLISENSSDLLRFFNSFDLTNQNDICFCDNLKRKIYFI